MNRHRRLLGWTAAFLLCGALATAQDDLSSAKLRIEWSAFKKLYDAKNVVVIDVRDQISYESGHIPGARLIPYDQVDSHLAELKKIKRPIVVYCA